ncbi:MAG: flagellar protein [Candidatus Desulforudis sp.]|nr:flagellar protein [Desulforudis sp.]
MVKKVGSVPVPPAPAPPAGVQKGGRNAFQEILTRELWQAELKFSAHARKRLAERQISLSAQDLEKISRAASLAETKGARQSLLIYGDLALVTSIANRTVVTAVTGEAALNNIFTNIDSAVIVK